MTPEEKGRDAEELISVHQVGPTVHIAHPDDLGLIGCWEQRKAWFDDVDKYEPTSREPRKVPVDDLIASFEQKRVFLCRVDGCWPGRGTGMLREAASS